MDIYLEQIYLGTLVDEVRMIVEPLVVEERQQAGRGLRRPTPARSAPT